MTQEDVWNDLKTYTWAQLSSKYYNFANDFRDLVAPTDAETMWNTVRAADFATLKSYWAGAYRIFSSWWPPTLENIIITNVEIDPTTTFPVMLGDYGNWEVTITNPSSQIQEFGSETFELYYNEKLVQSLPSPGSINPGQTYSFWMTGKYIDMGDTYIKVVGPGNEVTYEYFIRVVPPPEPANVALVPWTLRVEPATIPKGKSVITVNAQVKNYGGETGYSNFQVSAGPVSFQNEFFVTMQPGEVRDLSIKVWVDLPNAGTVSIRAKMEGESELVAQMFDVLVMETTGSLLFIVTDVENHLPVQDALVKIETVGFIDDRLTDALGRGEFMGIQNGEYAYTISKEGYETQPGSIIVLPGPQTTKSIVLEHTEPLPTEMFVIASTDKTDVKVGEPVRISGLTRPWAEVELIQKLVGYIPDNPLGLSTTADKDGQFEIIFPWEETGEIEVYAKACLVDCADTSNNPITFYVTSGIPEIFVTATADKTEVVPLEMIKISGQTLAGAKVELWQHQWGLIPDNYLNLVSTADNSGNYEINFYWEETGEPGVYVKACSAGNCADTSGTLIEFKVIEGELPPPPGTITKRLRIWKSEEVLGDDEKVFTVAWDGDLVDTNIHIEVSTVIPQTVVFYLNDNKIVQDGIYYPHSVSYDVDISEYLMNGINTIRFDAGTFAVATSLFGYVDVSILGEFTDIGEPEPGFFDQYKTPLLVGGGILALYVLIKASKATMPSFTLVAPSAGRG